MKPGESLSEQQELARGGAEPVRSDAIVEAAQRAQEEGVMFLLAGNLDPEKVLKSPDYRKLGYDEALGAVA